MMELKNQFWSYLTCVALSKIMLFLVICISEKATSADLQAEDWSLNLEICDIINETDDG